MLTVTSRSSIDMPRIVTNAAQQVITRVVGMGDLRVFKRVRVMTGGVMQTVFQFFSAAVTPNDVVGNYYGASAAPQNITTSTALATPIGGTAPFTYAWQQAGITADSWTITNPTSASTKFTALAITAGSAANAQFVCVMTDATGAVATTSAVNANAYNNSTV